MKKHEVEYRALITRVIFEQLCRKGRRMFAESFRGPLTIEDVYFCPKDTKSFDEIEMEKIGSYGLRLRRETHNNVVRVTFNAKILTSKGDHSTGLEQEVAVSSFEDCKSVLTLIGFKPFFRLKKDRYTYIDGEVRICLEDIDGFQPIIEVEIIAAKDKIDESRKKLLAFLSTYNIPRSAIVEKSITNMLMRKRAVFDWT